MRTVAALLLLLTVSSVARAEIAPENLKTVELVPAVHRGHTVTWTVGAIITCTSVGVSLLGAGLVLSSFRGEYSVDNGLWISGLVMSVAGDGGLAIGGPITWLAGIRHDSDTRSP